MASYKTVDYYDPIKLGDVLVCHECGALVHPNSTMQHDAQHDHDDYQTERINRFEGV